MTILTPDLGRLMDTNGRYFFSPKEVVGFRNEEQGRTHTKPWGLWYACGDDWLKWVMADMPEWSTRWQYLYRVVATDDILQLTTVGAVRKFDARYRFSDPIYNTFVNWAAVAKDFPGIEICPYQWDLRRLIWYNVWDVASGCLWNERGLDYILPVAQRIEHTELWEI